MQIRLLFLLFALFLGATSVESRCKGKDLFARSSPEFQAAIQSAAEKYPYHTGLYWEISKAGKTSWIIGTIHISDTRVSRIPGFFRKKIASSRLVLVEATESQSAEFMQKILQTPPKTPAKRSATLGQAWASFTPKEQKLLEKEARSKNLSIERMKFLPLGILSLLIDKPKCDRDNQRYLDIFVEKAAIRARVPVSGLDDANTIARLISNPDIDDATYVNYVKRELPRLKQRRHEIETLVQMYLRGETAKYWEYSKARIRSYLPKGTARSLERETFDRLIVERNKSWMKRLRREIRDGNVVVAVGAGHLSGKSGLLYLLRQEGFTIKRLSCGKDCTN
ncbi:MAG: TraB/GumN family protein [Rhodobacteraceae bacterium]|nr:TraB/GumN family protein [Paracoccaceae bacterium]